jgi:hypothetical protein
VYTVYFWNNPLVHLGEIRRVMRADGRFVLAFTPKEDAYAVASFRRPSITSIANYLLMYGSTPGAALKAPQDNSPGQRPGSLNAVKAAPYMGARVRTARSRSAPQLHRPPRIGMGLTPRQGGLNSIALLTEGVALG